MKKLKKLREKFTENEIKKNKKDNSVLSRDWTPASRAEILELLRRVEILEKAVGKSRE